MKLNEEQVAFNFQLGYAITRWASVEQSILEFGTSCLLEDDRKAFGYAFCQLDSFRAKLALIDGIAAVKHKGKKDLLADWATLQKMTRALSATRNKLAHYQLGLYPTGKAGRRMGLVPWALNEKTTKTPDPKDGSAPTYAVCVQDIADFHVLASQLSLRLQNLACRSAGWPMRYEESLLPSVRRSTTRNLRDLIYKVLQVQHPP